MPAAGLPPGKKDPGTESAGPRAGIPQSRSGHVPENRTPHRCLAVNRNLLADESRRRVAIAPGGRTKPVWNRRFIPAAVSAQAERPATGLQGPGDSTNPRARPGTVRAPPGRSMHPVPAPTVMGRAAAVPAAIGPPMPCPVWWPVTIAMAMPLPVTMLVPVTMALPVAMTPSVMAGRITIAPGRVVGVRPVIGNPPVMPSIDLPDDDPDGQCRKGAGKQSLGDVIGMPPVVGRGASGRDQKARYQKRGDKAANHGRLSVHDDPPGP